MYYTGFLNQRSETQKLPTRTLVTMSNRSHELYRGSKLLSSVQNNTTELQTVRLKFNYITESSKFGKVC
jgi:predicted house-cleaning NTP pyrophosphatase (Maf/HAM1 superfamily)